MPSLPCRSQFLTFFFLCTFLCVDVRSFLVPLFSFIFLCIFFHIFLSSFLLFVSFYPHLLLSYPPILRFLTFLFFLYLRPRYPAPLIENSTTVREHHPLQHLTFSYLFLLSFVFYFPIPFVFCLFLFVLIYGITPSLFLQPFRYLFTSISSHRLLKRKTIRLLLFFLLPFLFSCSVLLFVFSPLHIYIQIMKPFGSLILIAALFLSVVISGTAGNPTLSFLLIQM